MAQIIPFSAVRFDKNTVGDLAAVTSPPHDIISPEQQKKLYDAHPFNVVRLELSEAYDDDDEYNNKYIRSGSILREWLESGVLNTDSEPSFYIYGQEFTLDGKTHSLKGIMCLAYLEDFEKGIIVPHEETVSKIRNDRFNLMCATGANISAVYSLYTDSEKNIESAVNSVFVNNPPETEFTSHDGVRQRLWRISDEDTVLKIQNEFKDKQLFIADGHHRYEAAINYRNMMREKNPYHTGDEPYNYIMMFLVETGEPGLVILPSHRLVKNVIDFDEQKTLSLLKDSFEIRRFYAENNIADAVKASLADRADEKVFAMYTGKDYYYMLTLNDPEYADAANASTPDVTILHSLILDKVFGIDKESLQSQRNLTYTYNWTEAETLTKTNAYQCAFFLNPVTIGEFTDICLSNERIPQKSTYFYPKLITGMIMNKF